MVLPPLELFSLKKEAALLPGGFFHFRMVSCGAQFCLPIIICRLSEWNYLNDMEIGQRVRIIKVPDGVGDSSKTKTRTLFQRCLGEIFPVMGFNGEFLALDVGGLNGVASYLETIYIEPSCVELVAED